MFYNSRNGIIGCLSTIIFFTIIFWIIKGSFWLIKEFWWLIVGLLLIIIVNNYGKLIYQAICTKNITNKEYEETPMGEVYKICPHCNAQVKVTQTTCPRCKRALN